MKILGIETSCDETAVSVLDITPPSHQASARQRNSKVRVLSNIVSSQVKLHAKYGGVFPSLAAREHEKNLPHVFKDALRKSGVKLSDIDLIAVTRGPGLAPSLWRGFNFAKELAENNNIPLIGVNHLEGHIYSNWLKPVGVSSKLQTLNSKLPILNLIVSGGHTELVLMTNYNKYKLIGETLDDAIGEAFDKVARLLKLGYPGGPAIAQRATKFKVKNLKLKIPIEFPSPMINSKDYNFSYSGLKTSVLYKIRDLEKEGVTLTPKIKDEICYEFQKAAIEVIIKKTIRAAKEYKVKSIFLSGGVSANKYLRTKLSKEAVDNGFKYSQPEFEYTGDNAAMITLAGYINKFKVESLKLKVKKLKTGQSPVEVDANLGL